MDFFSNTWDWFKGNSFSSSLAKTALVGYISRLINKSTSPTSTGSDSIVDPGVRLQLNPSTDNRIPVLYGSAYFGGYITDAQLSSDYKKMTYCLTLAEITGIRQSAADSTGYYFRNVYINNNRVVFKSDGITVDYTLDSSGNQDISYRDCLKIYFYGHDTGFAPVGHAVTIPSPYTTMPGWSSATHSMADLLYSIVEVTYNRDSGVTGLPDITYHVESDMVLPGDVLADYMMDTVYGAGISIDDIDANSILALNTYASTGFTYTNKSGQSTSSQITINGLVDTATDVLTNMQAIAEAAGAWLTYNINTGLWRVVINKAGTSVASFDDSNIIGEISVTGTSLTQLNNVADVKYQNTDILDKTDFVKISIPSNHLYANEPMNTIQINLPFTNKQVVAAKIGLQQLKQARVDKVISFKTDYSYILLNAGDIISITSPVYGFANKLFRIITVIQSEGDAGEILLDFTALEYDSAVYDYDITEYAVETDNGILGIGSIGKPNTPTVTKTEEANVPKIVINAVVPSGIVDAVEYWITFDTTTQNDTARNYIKIGQYSNTNGSILTEDATASYTYTGLQQSDFYVKVRGINSVTTGPFSNPSGLITYKPTVVADTVSDSPVSIGGQLMSLGLLTLLNNLDKLFTGDSSTGGVFGKVFETFKNVTGYDLLGAAGDGTLNVTYVPGDATAAPCYLDLSSIKYPADRSTGDNPVQNSSGDRASSTGDYYFYVNPGSSTAALSKGSGSIKLYKSDGTLSQTIPGSAVTITGYKVSIPFTARDKGVDYYILMDKNVVNNGTCELSELNDPKVWNFHTADPQDAILPAPPVVTPPVTSCGPLEFQKIITYKTSTYVSSDKPTQPYGVIISPDNKLVDVETNIGIQFNQSILLSGAGIIQIKKVGGLTHQQFDLSHTFKDNKISELVWVSGNTLWLNPTIDLDRDTEYYVTLSGSCVKNACNTAGNSQFGSSTTTNFKTDAGPKASSKSSQEGNLSYDRPVTINSDKNINIVNPSNVTVATIPGNSPALSTKEN